MSAKFVWRKEYNIGVDIIDKEHQRLFKIINKLFLLKEEEKNEKWACQEGIKFFKSHAVKHFMDEEAYMASIGYKGLEQHKRIHTGFRENTLPALEQELEQTDYSQDAMEHFLGVCTGWLIGHTITEDFSITGKRERKWKDILSYEETEAIKKVIIQLVFDMFHLESQMISDTYCGEKFGKGVYYRLVYIKDKYKEKQEIILAFEEKLLINTVGKVMGLHSNRLDNMLLHAARHMARQFVERIMKHFPDTETYELKEESLLTYEQFQKILEWGRLQVGLLFNTGGAGYFSYCVIAPYLLEKGVGTPIEEETAMDEVDKYLMERNEKESDTQKKKILVVDDSIILREGIKRMLDNDYDVATAESGVAAIRAITINRPDLVLLDYEMPVCDGKQMLEMLRSEKEFNDISVIFLTGKNDLDSITKVMPLKPAGYLLKQQKPEDIKKEISTFFKKLK